MTECSLPPAPFSNNAILAVGVSGGADSLGLLWALWEQLPQASQRLKVLHVNYGLRGKDSLRDEQRVKEVCQQLGLSFHCYHIARFKQQLSHTKGSLQDLARDLRYGYFQKRVLKEKAWGVAVAHHLEDQAETVMDRILRGAGGRGLSGLRPVQTLDLHKGQPGLKIWRPLLSYKKDHLKDFLRSRGVTWREDKSNQGLAYRRNQIRHKILPFLTRWNPRLTETLARLGDLAQIEEQFLESLLPPVEKKLDSRWKARAYSCDSKKFRSLPLALKRRWVRSVCEKITPQARGLSFDRIGEIIRLWEGESIGPRDIGFGLIGGKKDERGYLNLKR